MRNFIYFGIALALLLHVADKDNFWTQITWWEPVLSGEAVPKAPIQVNLAPGEMPSWIYKGYTFTPLARYDITARVLHRCDYPPGSDDFDGICPLDLTLAWGRMSDPSVYGQLEIGQISRHSSWNSSFFNFGSSFPLSWEEVNSSASNNHIIPANAQIQAEFANYGPGDIIRFSGYLVAIVWPDGATCKSSLTRTDEGDGACEVIWVNQAAKLGR